MRRNTLSARENARIAQQPSVRLRFGLIRPVVGRSDMVSKRLPSEPCHQRSSPIWGAPQRGFGGLTARKSHPDPSLRTRPWSQQPPRHRPRLRTGHLHHDRPDRRAPITAAGPRARPDTPAGSRPPDPADRLRRRALVRARACTSISTRSSSRRAPSAVASCGPRPSQPTCASRAGGLRPDRRAAARASCDRIPADQQLIAIEIGVGGSIAADRTTVQPATDASAGGTSTWARAVTADPARGRHRRRPRSASATSASWPRCTPPGSSCRCPPTRSRPTSAAPGRSAAG